MPSRRRFLAGVGAACGALAGCTVVETPRYARWLHAPRAVLDAPAWGFAAADVAAVRRHRRQLPRPWVRALDRVDDAVGALSLSAVGGVALGIRRTGLDAVRATLRARTRRATRLVRADEDARTAADALAGADLVVCASLPDGEFERRVPGDQSAFEGVVRGLRALAVGAAPSSDGATTRVVLASEEGRRPSLADVRTLFRETGDRPGVDPVAGVGIRQSGDVVVVTTSVDLAALRRNGSKR